MSSFAPPGGGAVRRPSWANVAAGSISSTPRVHRSNHSVPNLNIGNNSSFSPSTNGQTSVGQMNHPISLPSYLEESCYGERLSSLRNPANTPQTIQPTAGSAGSAGQVGKGTYRGPGLDVKDSTQTAKEAALPLLPSRWSEEDKSNGIEVSNDGFDVKFVGPHKVSENDAAAVRANNYMPPQCGVFYFEVTIVNKGREGLIGIGFCTKNFPLTRLPGWEPESWGYHGDDGRAFCCQGIGKTYGPMFNTGDVIGCGVNFRNHTAFFTRNGNELGTAFKDTNKGKLYPAVGMKRVSEHVRVNFGQRPFVFDIEGYVRQEKALAYNEINKASVAKLCPPLDEASLIQSLIATYLQHDGYVETARAFAEDLQKESQALQQGNSKAALPFDLKEDVDAVNRQSIRGAILNGDIDHALALTNKFYPEVLANNEKIRFRLRCRKFIEMMRMCSETKPSSDTSNGRAKNDEQDVDMDDDHLQFGSGNRDWEMETDEEDDSNMNGNASAGGMTGKDMLDAALEYGRELQDDYKDKPEMRKALDEAFSLFAYTDPKNSVVGHLLEEEGRLAVAEELNSAILVSLGKSSIAPLERLIQQTTVLVREVSEEGGPATLVNVQDWISSPNIHPM